MLFDQMFNYRPPTFLRNLSQALSEGRVILLQALSEGRALLFVAAINVGKSINVRFNNLYLLWTREGDTVLAMHSKAIINTATIIASISKLSYIESWTLGVRIRRFNKGEGSPTTVDDINYKKYAEIIINYSPDVDTNTVYPSRDVHPNTGMYPTRAEYDVMRVTTTNNTRTIFEDLRNRNYIERFWVAENIEYFNKCKPKTVNDVHYQAHARKKNWLRDDIP